MDIFVSNEAYGKWRLTPFNYYFAHNPDGVFVNIFHCISIRMLMDDGFLAPHDVYAWARRLCHALPL